jgi:hypothetical protein
MMVSQMTSFKRRLLSLTIGYCFTSQFACSIRMLIDEIKRLATCSSGLPKRVEPEYRGAGAGNLLAAFDTRHDQDQAFGLQGPPGPSRHVGARVACRTSAVDGALHPGAWFMAEPREAMGFDPPAQAAADRRLCVNGQAAGEAEAVHGRLERGGPSLQLGHQGGRESQGGGDPCSGLYWTPSCVVLY